MDNSNALKPAASGLTKTRDSYQDPVKDGHGGAVR